MGTLVPDDGFCIHIQVYRNAKPAYEVDCNVNCLQCFRSNETVNKF